MTSRGTIFLEKFVFALILPFTLYFSLIHVMGLNDPYGSESAGLLSLFCLVAYISTYILSRVKIIPDSVQSSFFTCLFLSSSISVFLLDVLGLSLTSISAFRASYWLIAAPFFSWCCIVIHYMRSRNLGSPLVLPHTNEARHAKFVFSLVFAILLTLLLSNRILDLVEIKMHESLLLVLTVITGCLALWQNERQSSDILEKESCAQRNSESSRTELFSSMFPIISKVPFLSVITRWLYREGYIYGLGLLFILGFGILLRARNLNLSSLWNDEAIIVITANNFLHGKGMTLLSGEAYLDSTITVALTSLSFLLFGVSETTARLPAVIIGSITVLVNYYFAKIILLNKNVALLSSLGIASSLWLVSYSREARFYSLNVLLSYVIIYFLYLGLRLKKNTYFFTALLFTIVAILNHKLMMVFIPVVVGLYLYTAKKGGHLLESWKAHVALIFCAALVAVFYHKTIYYFLFTVKTYNFWAHGLFFYTDLLLVKFFVLSLLCALGLAFSIVKKQDALSILYAIIGFILLTFSLIGSKTERYILVIFPFMILISTHVLYRMVRSMFSSSFSFIVVFLTMTLLVSPINDGYMVSQSKISRDDRLQKNKYYWREATHFLISRIANDDIRYPVLTSNGQLTSYYGLSGDTTNRKQKVTASDPNRSFYDGLRFQDDISSFVGYAIFDRNDKKKVLFETLIKSPDSVLIYDEGGMSIYFKSAHSEDR